MNFLPYSVTTGPLESVRVYLTGSAANVLLMDDSNFPKFQAGQAYRYYSGHYTRSPAVIKPPYPGRWDIVVSLGSPGGMPGAGTVNAVVQVVHA
jgi:hypothetical protein